MQKWEYVHFVVELVDMKVIEVDGENITKQKSPTSWGELDLSKNNFIEVVNFLGIQGWEAVGFSNGWKTDTAYYLFKRPLED